MFKFRRLICSVKNSFSNKFLPPSSVSFFQRRADFDAALRGVLRAFENRVCVAVDLPVPDAIPAVSLAQALRLDPDVIALRYPCADIPNDLHIAVASTQPIDGAHTTVAVV